MIYLMKERKGAHAIFVDAPDVKQAKQKLKDEGYRIVGKLVPVPDFIVSLQRLSPAPAGRVPNYRADASGTLGLWLNSEHRIEIGGDREVFTNKREVFTADWRVAKVKK